MGERFRMDEADLFVKKLLENMKALGAGVNMALGHTPKYVNKTVPTAREMEEVTKKLPELERIWETTGEHGELEKTYRMAVEYFSAQGSDEYKPYLEKLRALTAKRSGEIDRVATSSA